VVTVVRVVTLPELLHRRDEFAQVASAVLGGQSTGQTVELELVGTAGDTQFRPAATDDVEEGGSRRPHGSGSRTAR
jgi:hypothetical protein